MYVEHMGGQDVLRDFRLRSKVSLVSISSLLLAIDLAVKKIDWVCDLLRTPLYKSNNAVFLWPYLVDCEWS